MVANEKPMQTELSESPETSRPDAVVNIPDGHDQSDEDQVSCRLCYGTRHDDSNLIEPCLCKGTMAKVHRKCLEKWLNRVGSTKCDLCLFEFKCAQTRRYGMCQSIGVWLRHHREQRFLMHDFCLFFVMNCITLSMIVVLLQAIYHVSSDENIRRALPMWYFLALCIATVLWIAIYCLTILVFVNTQIRPWFHWWQTTKKIQLSIN